MSRRCTLPVGSLPLTIRAALFDFGGVLLTSPFEAFSRYERSRGLPDGAIRTINSTNPDDNAWAYLERGAMTLDEFARAFEVEAQALGFELDGHEVLALLAGDLRPAMVEAVRRCQQRLKTAMLTNNFVVAGDVVDRSDPMSEVLALFDVIVESSKAGVRKPDPAFYELACELLEIDPTEAVFLDDLGVNLKPARALGMTTIKVEDPTDAIKALEGVVGFALG
jgi:putative hydrolase of the HAD superfamily